MLNLGLDLNLVHDLIFSLLTFNILFYEINYFCMFAYKTMTSMKYFNSFVVIVIIIAAAAFSSCTKMKKDKLDEDWRLIRVDQDSTISWFEIWQFQGEMVYMITRPSGGTAIDTLYSAEYTVKSGVSKTTLTMQQCSNTLYNGDWEVLTLNKDMLVLLNRTDGEFVYREFIKE